MVFPENVNRKRATTSVSGRALQNGLGWKDGRHARRTNRTVKKSGISNAQHVLYATDFITSDWRRRKGEFSGNHRPLIRIIIMIILKQ
jgi:hypothetical protein